MNTTPPQSRPRTVAEIAALPEGPAIGFEEFSYTEQDRKNGYIVVRGKRLNIVVGCNSVKIPIMPEVVAQMVEDNDILGYTGTDGIHWILGLYADGRWFRQRA